MDLLIVRPRSPQNRDDGLALEAEAADLLGIEVHAIDIESVVDDEIGVVLETFPPGEGRSLLYRGWMLTEEEYEALYEALGEHGYTLCTSPWEYAQAHYVSSWYERIAEHTAASAWTWSTDLDEAWDVAHSLGEPPWLLKDHVKSAKERWSELGVIPAGCSRERFDAICAEFIDHRGERFERGLCFRRPMALRRLGVSDSGQPVHDEHRIFFWQGKPVACAAQHELDGSPCAPERFAFVGECIDSPFFTVDVARREDGQWAIVEIGDGGVSMLPVTLDPRHLFDVMGLALDHPVS